MNRWPPFDLLDLLRAGMKPNRLAVFLYLWRRSDSQGTCFPSIGRMAKELLISSKTVSRCLKWLKEQGFIRVEPRRAEMGGRMSNLYQVRSSCPIPMDKISHEDIYKLSGDSTLNGPTCPIPPDPESHTPQSLKDFSQELLADLLKDWGVELFRRRLIQVHKFKEEEVEEFIRGVGLC